MGLVMVSVAWLFCKKWGLKTVLQVVFVGKPVSRTNSTEDFSSVQQMLMKDLYVPAGLFLSVADQSPASFHWMWQCLCFFSELCLWSI